MPDREVRAAGGVLWRQGPDGVEVAVVHRPKYDDWSLPKGKLEPGELAPVAAVREVCEETGHEVALGRRLGETRYDVEQDGVRVPKRVSWWVMRSVAGDFTPNDEVDQLRWLAPEDALPLLGSRNDEPLRALLDGPLATTTLLLLRHGHAGDKHDWPGDDRDRPLDERGAKEAEAAAHVLTAWAPERVLTAPLERCRATVRPLARVTGLVPEDDDLVSADAWARDASATVERLRDLAAKGSAVVCSQGEVIPGAVRALAERDGLALGDVHAPKGGVWALSFDDRGRLVDADPWPSLRG